MISSLLNYRLYTDNLAKTLERVEAGGTVAREAKYYKDNIGGVAGIEEFLGDQRLYAYALKAYGLEDQIGSKAFIRKVLESDLADTASFANTLVDGRYRTFAAAFDFGAAGAPKALQSANQADVLVEAYSERSVRGAVAAAAKTAYYEEAIRRATSAEAFVADDGLFDVAMRAIGRDPAAISRDYVRGFLDGTRGDDPDSPGDDDFAALASRFGFGSGGPAQTPAQVRELVYAFNEATGNGNSPQASAAKVAYYQEGVAAVASVDDLVGDPRLFDFVMTAGGFETTYVPEFVRNILASDPADPASAVNTQLGASTGAEIATKEKFLKLIAAFDFAPDGAATPGAAQSPEALDALVEDYYANHRNKASGADALATNSFRVQVGRMRSLGDLLASDVFGKRPTYDYVLRAFDLDPATESTAKIRKVLQSDASDPASFVNRLGDERYERLAAAFNFDSAGRLRAERLIQSTVEQSKVATLYAASFGADLSGAKGDVVKAETKRYLEAVGSLRTLDDFLADEAVVAYALTAHGLGDRAVSASELRKVLTSDLADPASHANRLGDKRWTDFAASFRFTPAGTVSAGGEGAQDANARFTTANLFLLQTLEEQAGETSEGTRLALYFLRKSPDIRNSYSILADKALFEVARTSLGLPASMAQMDIDVQARILETRLDFADFADPAKLDRFIARFAVLHDLDGAGAVASPILALFGGGGSAGGVLGLL